MRKILGPNQIDNDTLKVIESYHAPVVTEAEAAIQQHDWVVIGMKQNPVVKKARAHLTANGIAFHYIEHGSYVSKWKERLAIKLWSGWPTFPQVFHKGKLLGGYDDLKVKSPAQL